MGFFQPFSLEVGFANKEKGDKSGWLGNLPGSAHFHKYHCSLFALVSGTLSKVSGVQAKAWRPDTPVHLSSP